MQGKGAWTCLAPAPQHPGFLSSCALLGLPPRMRPARSALGVTSRARSRPAAGGRSTAVPPSRVPGVAGLRAPEQQRLRLPAKAAGAAPTPGTEREAPPCRGRRSGQPEAPWPRLGTARTSQVPAGGGALCRGRGSGGAVGVSGRQLGSALGTELGAAPLRTYSDSAPFSSLDQRG